MSGLNPIGIVLIAGRVGSEAWSRGRVVADLAQGLASRGHWVSLVCESVADARAFSDLSPAMTVRAMHRFEESASDFPLGFSRWGGRNAARAVDELWAQTRVRPVTLSLTRRVGGEVWMPLDPSAGSWLGELRAERGWLGSTTSIAKHAGVTWTRAREVVSAAPWPGGSMIRRVITIGPEAADQARRQLGARLGRLVMSIEPVAEYQSVSGGGPIGARSRVRALMNVGETDQLLIVGQCAGGTGSGGTARAGGRADGRVAAGVAGSGRRYQGGLSEMLAALQSHLSADGGRPSGARGGVRICVLCRDQFLVHTAAVRAGLDGITQTLGLTHCIADLLLAGDALVLPTACAGGSFAAGTMGRLAATSLALGKPIIAAEGAPGYELIRRRDSDNTEPGLIVNAVPGGWRRAFKSALDPVWLARATRAAQNASGTVGRTCLAEAIEPVLRAVAAERADG